MIRVDAPEWTDFNAGDPGVTFPEVGDESLYMLIFTSGTSGEPKAVRVTHAKVWFPGVVLADLFSLTADDVLYVSMPLFHSNAVMSGYAPALVTGATLGSAVLGLLQARYTLQLQAAGVSAARLGTEAFLLAFQGTFQCAAAVAAVAAVLLWSSRWRTART